jgi:membrane protease subunit HflC
MKKSIGLVVGIFAAVVIVLTMSAAFIVDQREQVLVLQFGDPKRVIQEPGLNFKIPFIQQVVRFDKRLLDYDNAPEEVIAADQKRLVVDAFARYHIIDPLKFYQTVGSEMLLRPRLGSAINSTLRQVLGTAPLQQVVSEKRGSLMLDIRNIVRREALTFGIQVEDVRIKRADLPDENSEAIYRRMQTERQQEAAELRAKGAEEAQKIRAEANRQKVVIVAEAERDSQILRGDGEGEMNRIFADAFGRDPEFFSFYRSMQAYEAALGADDTTMVLSPDSDFFRYFGSLMDVQPSE